MPDIAKKQPDINTFTALIERAASLFADRDAFRIRTRDGYTSISYSQFREDVFALAAALHARGLSDTYIAVIGENSYQWVLAYLGAVVANSVIVPIDKELTADEIKSILVQSEAKALFCSGDYSEIADELQRDLDIEYFAMGNQSDRYTNCSLLLEEGKELRRNDPSAGRRENDPMSLSTIVFTSGTTGYSKGVMLSRHNIMCNLDSCNKLIHLGERVLSVLPMHHTYEFTLGILYSIYQGLTICINNSIKYFAQNMKIFAPTDMLVVPLIAENMYAMIWQNIQKSGKEKLLRRMIKVSNCLMAVGIDLRRQFFKPVHEALGGKLESLFVGGAYFDPEIAKGYHQLGIRINIGYGITECSPLVCGNITDKMKYMASCGEAIPDVEVRIKNPDDNGEGEIQVRGENVMMGYFKDPEATADVFDGDWFRTGDIGRLNRRKMLFITGRLKNVIVLKNGKKIYPEELESLISKLPYVKEVIVSARQNNMGEELAITAEIYPDMEAMPLKKTEDAIIEIQTEIEGLNSQLPYYKRIVGVKFRDTEFPKTTSKKIKRYNN